MGKIAAIIAFICFGVSLAQAAGRDPDWPCHQPKVGEFPLASVWDGPPVDTGATAWRDDSQIAELVAAMAQRRTPLEAVQGGVNKLVAAPEGKSKVLQAFAAAFDDLTRQRAEIIAGLLRYGRRSHEMAEHIRAENETAHRETTPGAGPDEAAMQKLQWDLRVFEDRRRTANYVCEAPQAIETRIGEIVKIVRAAL